MNDTRCTEAAPAGEMTLAEVKACWVAGYRTADVIVQACPHPAGSKAAAFWRDGRIAGEADALEGREPPAEARE